MDHALLITSIVALFPLVFAGIWCIVVVLLSALGGWRRLAQRFPAPGQPSGRRFVMQGGKVGWVSYRGCLTLHSSPEGLYLSVWLLFRPGHPPLLIPWNAIHNARTRRFFGIERVLFDVGSPAIATLQLAKKVFEGHEIIA